MNPIDLNALSNSYPFAAYVGRAANDASYGGVDLDDDTNVLTCEEWQQGLPSLRQIQGPRFSNREVNHAVEYIHAWFSNGSKATSDFANTQILRVAEVELQKSQTGKTLLRSFRQLGGEIQVLSDEEFMRRYDCIGATPTKTPDGRPELLIAQEFFRRGPTTVAVTLAHEIVHVMSDKETDQRSRIHPFEAWVWAETLAATIQAKVEVELNFMGGSAARNDDGSLRTIKETADAIRNDSGHSQDATAMPLRWPLNTVGPPLSELL